MWLISSVALIFVSILVEGSTLEDYSRTRKKVLSDEIYKTIGTKFDPKILNNECLMTSEEKLSIYGESLKLNDYEIIANETLMIAKLDVVNKGFNNPAEFWPSRNFLDVRENIARTELFKLIQMMPKGAALHTHGGSTASLNYLYEILTYLSNLYVCLDNKTWKFRYFETPDTDCEWKLLKKLREEDPKTVSKLRDYFIAPLKRKTAEYNVSMARKDLARKFSLVEGLITYRPAFEIYVQRSLQELWDDNVLYMEFRAPIYRLYELNGTVHDPIEAIRIFKRVVDKFVEDHPGFVGAKYILSSDKLYDHSESNQDLNVYRDIKRAFPNSAVGFNISNGDDVNHLVGAYVIQESPELNNENLYIHTGETKLIGDVVDKESIAQIVRHTIRVKHCSSLSKSLELMDMIKQRNITIDVNPISNQVLGYVDDMRTHPASRYFAENLLVVIANDIPSFWGASGLSYDFYESFVGITPCNADLRSLKQLVMNSIENSAMKKQEKQLAFQTLQNSWLKFVQELVNKYRFFLTKKYQNEQENENY